VQTAPYSNFASRDLTFEPGGTTLYGAPVKTQTAPQRLAALQERLQQPIAPKAKARTSKRKRESGALDDGRARKHQQVEREVKWEVMDYAHHESAAEPPHALSKEWPSWRSAADVKATPSEDLGDLEERLLHGLRAFCGIDEDPEKLFD
ncbi:hypothetical protein LTR53_019375, partial [Teratosphaeriaceae sp. CCFEE 6253]